MNLEWINELAGIKSVSCVIAATIFFFSLDDIRGRQSRERAIARLRD